MRAAHPGALTSTFIEVLALLETAREGKPMILVTGATGSVGRHVVSQLLAQGTAVRAVVRNPDGDLPTEVEVVRADLADPASLDTVLAGVDSVFLLWPFFSVDGAFAVVDSIARHA
ncbi:MAG: SDR family oxidoreductase, partial [Actinomycetes bacterium]